jgi:hypothetical protein
LSRLIAVKIGVKLGSDETVNIEFYTSFVSGLCGSGFGKVKTLLDEKIGLGLTSLFPGLSEPRVAMAPGIEGFKIRQVWVVAKELDHGAIGRRKKIEERGGKLFSEGLAFAFGPRVVAPVGDGAEFSQCRGHSGEEE